MSETSIKGVLQNMISGETTVLSGTVISSAPLKVKIQDDSGLTLGSAVLIVPEHVKEKKINLKIEDKEQEIIVNKALEVGDNVAILSIDRGSIYYILGRE